MKRLGYTRYVAQGGDIGAPVSSAMARIAPAGLLGIHTNLPATVPAGRGQGTRRPRPGAGRTLREGTRGIRLARRFNKVKSAYVAMMGTRPQTIGYSLTDSPAGLAAWMIDHDEVSYAAISQGLQRAPRRWPDARCDPRQHHAVLADEHRDLRSAAVLGKQGTKPARCGRTEDLRDLAPGRHLGVSGRDLSSSGDVGPARLSQPDLLPRSRQGRTLRGVGAARAVRCRAARRIQITS